MRRLTIDELRTVCSDLEEARTKLAFLGAVLGLYEENGKHAEAPVIDPYMAAGLYQVSHDAYRKDRKAQQWADQRVRDLDEDDTTT